MVDNLKNQRLKLLFGFRHSRLEALKFWNNRRFKGLEYTESKHTRPHLSEEAQLWSDHVLGLKGYKKLGQGLKACVTWNIFERWKTNTYRADRLCLVQYGERKNSWFCKGSKVSGYDGCKACHCISVIDCIPKIYHGKPHFLMQRGSL